MQVSISRRNTCRLCDGAHLELVVPMAPTTVAEKYVTEEQLEQEQKIFPLDLYMCLDCGHVQLLDIIEPKFLFSNYTFVTSNTSGLIKHFEEYADSILKRFDPTPNALVVDVGSNDGTLLRCFQKRGFRVLGVDPASEIANKATMSGIETLPEFMTVELAHQIKKRYGDAAIVTANNVFAHADDLATMADSIRVLLAPDGIFVFEVSYLLDIIERMLLGTIFHEHLSYHSLRPMVEFLERHSMELIDVNRVTTQGGSLIGTAQCIGGPRSVSTSIGELLELEKNHRLYNPETLKGFAVRLQKTKNKVGSMIADFKRQGKTIAGYGAARSGTTLIAQMNLGKIINFIVDDSSEKQYKFSPGDKIPVLPTKAIYERKPDYVFILAWIHAKKIIANHKKYLDQGGHFIICFPEVQVIGSEEMAKL